MAGLIFGRARIVYQVNEPDYIYVRAWCKMLGWDERYSREQLQLARTQGAIWNATYFNPVEGRWVPKSILVSRKTQDELEQVADEIRKSFTLTL